MPFKCTQCDKVVQDNEIQDCSCESNHFLRCATIHFLHTEGVGPVFSRNQKIANVPGKIETPTANALKIACTTRKNMEQCTIYVPLITCAKCLEFLATILPTKQPEPDKPLNTDKLDLTPEELQALKDIGLSPNQVSDAPISE
jgi:recombinational DNA repair protein (RecF pathway)